MVSYVRTNVAGGIMKKDQFYVYILASGRNGTLYVGMTNDLPRRMLEHRIGQGSVFVHDYGVTRLVYYEVTNDPYDAIVREKRLKKWYREWKVDLIEAHNPSWEDLSQEGNILPLPR